MGPNGPLHLLECSDPDGDILSLTWDFGDGATGVGYTPTHTYTTPGIYEVLLIVNSIHSLFTSAKSNILEANNPLKGTIFVQAEKV